MVWKMAKWHVQSGYEGGLLSCPFGLCNLRDSVIRKAMQGGSVMRVCEMRPCSHVHLSCYSVPHRVHYMRLCDCALVVVVPSLLLPLAMVAVSALSTMVGIMILQ